MATTPPQLPRHLSAEVGATRGWRWWNDQAGWKTTFPRCSSRCRHLNGQRPRLGLPRQRRRRWITCADWFLGTPGGDWCAMGSPPPAGTTVPPEGHHRL